MPPVRRRRSPFVAGAAQIVRQAKEIPGLKDTKLIGGGSLMAPDLISAAGTAVVGFQIAYPDDTAATDWSAA